MQRRYEKLFDHEQKSWLNYVYNLLYPNENIHRVPMFYEIIYEINVFGERLLSKCSKGNHSAVVCAHWSGTGGTVSPSCDTLRVGVVQHFTVEIKGSSQETRKVPHMFAFVYWYNIHPRATWFHPHNNYYYSCFTGHGYEWTCSLLPISRIFAPCAIINFQMMFILIMV